MPSWSSPAPRPPAAQRGMRPPDQPARPAPAERARGPPAAGRPGLDNPHLAWLRARLVTMASTPSGPRPTSTLPASPTAPGAGVLTAPPAARWLAPTTLDPLDPMASGLELASQCPANIPPLRGAGHDDRAWCPQPTLRGPGDGPQHRP